MLTLMAGVTWAGDEARWKDEPIDPKVLTDVTAYTAGKKVWSLGVGSQDYGLLQNASLGTRAAFYLLGITNAHAKVTAIQTPKLDVSLQGEWLSTNLDGLRVSSTPIGWTGSWMISPRLSLHGGTSWLLVSARGEVGGDVLVEGLGDLIGVDVGDDLSSQLSASEVYAGLNASLYQTRLAMDYRLNRRDSLIVTLQNYVALSGLVAGGVGFETSDGVQMEAGPSARFFVPLKETLPLAATLSWQFSWEHMHLRLGVPLTKGVSIVYALPEALAWYWEFGGKKAR